MNVAAITFVFNEIVNLPIWRRYYGKNFGDKNLFIIDRESNDGSTTDLGEANRVVVPRDAFDDHKKTSFVSSYQHALLQYYDAVIYTDCDEILVPNSARYSDLNDYVSKMPTDYATGIGLNVLHILNQEPPLDLGRPVLAQRRYARFNSATCKTLVSRVPITWTPGFHGLNRRPQFDRDLFIFHIKTMDYSIASQRQAINNETPWSDGALAANHGAHHRYTFDRFVRESFFDPINIINQGKIAPFDFAEEIARFQAEIVERDGYFWIPMNIDRWVEIPDHLRTAF
jgi:hypothetical protein